VITLYLILSSVLFTVLSIGVCLPPRNSDTWWQVLLTIPITLLSYGAVAKHIFGAAL
jgi:Na+-translocating ferredoxin:NAD+ oxidoreductase RnfD subunit